MRKVVTPLRRQSSPSEEEWLDLEALARVEISSEEISHPVEAALLPAASEGWRASAPGESVLRLLFDAPQRIRRIELLFTEHAVARTQEFVLSWSAEEGGESREIVRQQYCFAPPETVRELEDYRVELEGVRELTLGIVPQLGGGGAKASLARLRVGG